MRRCTVLRTTLLAAALLLAAPMGTSREIASAEAHTSEAISKLLDLYSTQHPAADQRSVRALELLQRFYSSVGNMPVWADDEFSLARQALQQLRDADQHGLVPDDYLVRATIPHDAGHDPEQLARFDIELTAAVLRLLADLHSGRTAPDISWFGGTLKRASYDPAEYLRTALRQQRLDEAINAAQPANAFYHRVRQTLAQYRQLEPRYRKLAALPPLPEGGKLRPGMVYEGAAGLLERLVLLGDMPNSAVPANDGVYSDDMETGVKRFQMRHGLQHVRACSPPVAPHPPARTDTGTPAMDAHATAWPCHRGKCAVLSPVGAGHTCAIQRPSGRNACNCRHCRPHPHAAVHRRTTPPRIQSSLERAAKH